MLPLYSERLSELAAQAYQLSDQLCGSCRDLHALWPYIRLSRSSTGVEVEESKLTHGLRNLIVEGRRDVLIAGAADTGLLALVARAGIDYGVNIVVLDICETPLELCRQFAKQWSLPIETVRQDLRKLNARQQFDLVLVHGTLHFIDRSGRSRAVTRIRDSLRPGGRLVLLFNTSKAPALKADDNVHAQYATAVLSELKRQRVSLPDSEAVLCDRLAAHSRRRQLREGAFVQPGDATLLLEDAGFNVMSCEQVDFKLSGETSDLVSRISKRRFVAIGEPNRWEHCE
jgi:SAM-dependent methyltransferase